MTKSYDIFNGDADGICALHQMRLSEPCPQAELVTGVKRDIRLVERVQPQPGDALNVFDVSLKVNAEAVARVLEAGAHVRYFDHHETGDVRLHERFEGHIDTASDTCTSLIVDRFVNGRFRLWAVVAAFGDNLVGAAVAAAQPAGLDHTELARLHELGECLNYNAYGETVDDLHYHPADLYRTLAPYKDPRQFLFDEPVFNVLRSAYNEDLYRAGEVEPHFATDEVALYVLPNAAWSRRVNGIYGNRLAQANPRRAHAVLIDRGGRYSISVRAPIERPLGAAAFCAQFGGGGRERAGGIDALPAGDLDRFASALEKTFRRS